MAGQHGGPRPNSGRKPGKSLTAMRKQARCVEVMEEYDLAPIEVMFGNMVFWHRQAEKISAKLIDFVGQANPQNPEDLLTMKTLLTRVLECREKAQECAVDAAPYCHPRLQAVAISTDPTDPLSIAITDKMSPRDAALAYASTLGS